MIQCDEDERDYAEFGIKMVRIPGGVSSFAAEKEIER